jgi:hypothetical protein|nr:PCMD domain-containing protein [uncultured Porphyromonas sp.]
MNATHLLLTTLISGSLLSLGSCADPMAEKEAISHLRQGLEERKPGVVTTSQRFTFTRWIAIPKTTFTLPSIAEGEDPAHTYWSSASNTGYSLLAQSPTDYPVIPLQEGGVIQGAQIRSIKGFYFFGVGTNVIAGALYSGRVNRTNLVAKPLESTEFGQPYSAGVPDEMTFVYQYQAGDKVIHGQNKTNIPLPAADRGAASAVFYDVTQDDSYLNGTNLHTDPRILVRGYAELAPTESGKWATYTLKLAPTDPVRYAAIDLKKGKYRLALVFSSSFRGAEYIGAVGSELRLKEVTIKDRPTKKD